MGNYLWKCYWKWCYWCCCRATSWHWVYGIVFMVSKMMIWSSFVPIFAKIIQNILVGITNSCIWILLQQSHAPASLVSARNQSKNAVKIKLLFQRFEYILSDCVQITRRINVAHNAIQTGSLDWSGCLVLWHFVCINRDSVDSEKIPCRQFCCHDGKSVDNRYHSDFTKLSNLSEHFGGLDLQRGVIVSHSTLDVWGQFLLQPVDLL